MADIVEDLGKQANERGLAGIAEIRARDEIVRLRTALTAAHGYLLNAKIDLESGASKKNAIQTIDGGLRVLRAVLPQD